MKRLQIMIEEELDEALGREARANGTSKAALIRQYVAEKLEPPRSIRDDPLWDLVGMNKGSPDDSMSVNDVVYPR